MHAAWACIVGLGLLTGCGNAERDDDEAQGSGVTAAPGAGGMSSGNADSGSSGPVDDADDGASDDGEIERFDVGGGDGGGGGPQTCQDNVDIVFVMDVSTSMGPFFDRLEEEIEVVHAALSAYELPEEPHYGLVVFVDDFALVDEGDEGIVFTDVAELRASFEEWNQFTSSNRQVTRDDLVNTTWPENSLDAIHAAADGFPWRPADTTLRIVIHTTDDTFWNGPTNANGIPILHSYDETVTRLQDQSVRFFTFAARIGGQFEDTDVAPGFFEPFEGKPAMPGQTDGLAWSIDAVLEGTLSLSEVINEAVEDNYCEPYPPPG